jgi:putative DNA primase/helicase
VTKAPAGLGSWRMQQLPSSQVNKPGIIELFLVTHFPSGLYYTNESFHGYIAGAWFAQDERSDIRRKIAELMGSSAKGKKVNDTLTLLKDFQSVREADINKNKHLICLQNGTLDTNSYELLEHSPTHGLMTKTNIEWNPDATCPRWLQFLDEIFVNDIDKAQKIAFVKEWFGYCLVPDSSLHKFVLMVGAGGNGKSVLLFILTQLIGLANVSHAHIERLDEKYVRAELEGKLVNISSEISADATIADGYLKAIVAGDIVEAERKFKPSFSFRPYVRLIGATNGLPRLLDHSEGFARRAIILSFNRIFSEHEQDHTLEHTLLNELSGILTWAVEGLRQLRERKKFDIPSSSTAALAKYRKDSDPVQLFAEECLELIDGRGMPPAEIYRSYQDWNRQNGFSPMNKVRFGKRLAELLGDDKKHRSGGKDYWLVRINPNNDYLLSQSSGYVH